MVEREWLRGQYYERVESGDMESDDRDHDDRESCHRKIDEGAIIKRAVEGRVIAGKVRTGRQESACTSRKRGSDHKTQIAYKVQGKAAF